MSTIGDSPAGIPLLDHFRPPLSARRHWHAFHNAWATYVASGLNAVLPPGYFAEPNVQFGLEIDVATFDERPTPAGAGSDSGTATYAPPAPTLVIPFAPTRETVEILVFENRAGPMLAAAIELVSPANKDRDAHRQAFAAKCQAVLQSGAGLMIVDVVTERRADLHRLLLERLSPAEVPPGATGGDLFAAAYYPADGGGGGPTVQVWHEPLTIGRPLPELPLWLKGGLVLAVGLAATYGRTCHEQRIPLPSA